MINNWLQLLTDDERFVIEHHLIKNLEWARVMHAFEVRWNHEFIRTDRSLCTYQSNALNKIADFCRPFEDTMKEIFSSQNNNIPQEGKSAALQKGKEQ